MTIASAFENYVREVAEEALPPGVDRIVVEKAFYVGALKAVEIMSCNNRTIEDLKRASLTIMVEALGWLQKKFPEGWFLN